MISYRLTLILFVALLCNACVNLNHPTQSGAIGQPDDTASEAELVGYEQDLEPPKFPLYEDRVVQPTTEAKPKEEAVTANRETFDTKDLSIWYHIKESNQITAADNRRIKAQRDWFIKNQDYLNRVFERAEPLIPFIVEEIKKRDLPIELVLLPVIESAYNPYAYSKSHASGLWQFIPSTGRLYKLRQDWWYDGRRDIIKSTHAALDYLKYLHNRHGNDWLLALAAYNAGTGKVGRSVARNKKYRKKADYWSIRLPRETQLYVPKFLALADVVSNSQKYGVRLPHINLHPKVAKVDLGDPIDLSIAAEFADLETKDFYWLNAGFKRWTTGEGEHFQLLVPLDVKDQFEQKLAQLPKNERVQWAQYKIKQGDTLIKIAKRHNLSVDQIKKANQLKNSRIRAGKMLSLPVSHQVAKTSTTHINPWQQAFEQKFRSVKVHKVRRGESLWSIGRKYGVSAKSIARLNGISTRQVLRVGQKLRVKPSTKKSPTYAQSNQKKVIKYKVKPGDSLYRIAKAFNVSIPQIARWNTLNKNALIHPGQNLKLYVK